MANEGQSSQSADSPTKQIPQQIDQCAGRPSRLSAGDKARWQLILVRRAAGLVEVFESTLCISRLPALVAQRERGQARENCLRAGVQAWEDLRHSASEMEANGGILQAIDRAASRLKSVRLPLTRQSIVFVSLAPERRRVSQPARGSVALAPIKRRRRRNSGALFQSRGRCTLSPAYLLACLSGYGSSRPISSVKWRARSRALESSKLVARSATRKFYLAGLQR